MEEQFAAAARKYLKVEEGDYYHDEYESGLDHDDVSSLNEFARFFFEQGLKADQNKE